MPGEPSILQVVLMGLITVFIVLICIIYIIKLMSRLINSSKVNENSAPAQSVAAQQAVPAPVPAASVNNNQLVAAVSVAIAENMGTDVSHLRIHSIKRR